MKISKEDLRAIIIDAHGYLEEAASHCSREEAQSAEEYADDVILEINKKQCSYCSAPRFKMNKDSVGSKQCEYCGTDFPKEK